MRFPLHVPAACLALAGLVPSANALPVVPGDLAGSEGAGRSCIPFHCNEASYQQFYAAEAFPGAMELNAIAFRLNGNSAGRYLFDYDSVRITVSTAEVDLAAPSLSMEENAGADAVVVYDAPYSEVLLGKGSGRQGFQLSFNFDTPFHFDPSQGDLLVELTMSYGALSSSSVYLDFDYNETFTRVTSFRLGGSQADVGRGLVTRFSDRPRLAALPTPAGAPLLVTGFAGMALVAARRRKRASTA